jgi:hypothetical protein
MGKGAIASAAAMAKKLSKFIQSSPTRPAKIFGFGASNTNVTVANKNAKLHDYRSHFHQMLTDDWHFHVPNRSLWYVVFHSPGIPKDIQTRTLMQLETGNIVDDRGAASSIAAGLASGSNGVTANTYDIDAARKKIDKAEAGLAEGHPSGVSGCIFAQGVNIPSESMTTQRLSVPNRRGFIPGLIAGERADFNPLSLEFRETNTSFLDSIIRPWIVLSSHRGFIARGMHDPKNIKCNIDIYYLGLVGSGQQSLNRKKCTFYNCVPFQLAQQQSTYDTDSGAASPIDTQWAYTHYSVDLISGLEPMPPLRPGPGERPINLDNVKLRGGNYTDMERDLKRQGAG